jgi:hypothetical protein
MGIGDRREGKKNEWARLQPPILRTS